MPKRLASFRYNGVRPRGMPLRMRPRGSLVEQEEFDEDDGQSPAFQVFYEDGATAIYLSSTIVEPHAYDELCHLLRQTDEDTAVTMYVNSDGGDTLSGMAIIQAMRDCPAVIKTVLHPMALSMAAMIFLAGDEHEVPCASYMMLHHFRCGQDGKGNEILAGITASIAWFDAAVRGVCTGFLSESEILAVLDGKELYLAAEDIRARLGALELARADEENDAE